MSGGVLAVMAMEAEAVPLVERLGLHEAEGFLTVSGRKLPMRVWEGLSPSGEACRIVTCGRDPRFGVDAIGTQPAVLAAHLAIERFRPGLVISAGTAGGFAAHGARIGDVYLSEGDVVYHDRRIPISGFDEYGVGSYPSVDAASLAAELGLKRGVVSTGNSLDLPASDLAVMERTGAAVKEMEAAAVAWVCWLHGAPFLAVKAITDLVDVDSLPQEQFMANLRDACARLTGAMVRVLERLGREAV